MRVCANTTFIEDWANYTFVGVRVNTVFKMVCANVTFIGLCTKRSIYTAFQRVCTNATFMRVYVYRGLDKFHVYWCLRKHYV